MFESNYKDAGFPPPGQSFEMFTAKIVSLTPENNPKEMVVEMSDPGDPNDVKATLNAKLLLNPPPPGTMPVGSEIKFKGAAKAFQPTPFQVTFEIDPENEGKLDGWTGTGPANTKQTKQTKQKSGPPKSNTKQKSKGK